MLRILASLSFLLGLAISPALAGDAEIKAAQGAIDGQLKAFSRDNNAEAYDYAAPTIKRIFPTLDSFMSMVTNGYAPVHKPKSYAFGKSEEMGGNSVVQQVLIVGQDGKDYEAVYTLELQPDGRYLITGVSLRASNALST